MLSHSVVSDSLGPHGPQPARLLCPWGFSRQEYWSVLSRPPPWDLPNPGMEPRSPTLQVDSLPAEIPEKPQIDQTLYLLHESEQKSMNSIRVFNEEWRKIQFSSVQSLSRVQLFVTP